MSLREGLPRFLFVLPWDLNHLGGVNQVVGNLYRQAQETDRWRPMLLVSNWAHPKPAYQEVEGRTTAYVRLRSPWSKSRPWKALISFLIHMPSALNTLRKMLTEHNVSIVNIHYPSLAALSFTLLRAFGGFRGKVMLSFHGTDITHASETSGVERWMWRTLLRSADAIVSCSAALKQTITALAPECEHKVRIIQNGLDVEWFRAQWDRAFALEPELASRRYILNIGTFLHIKGQDILLEAFRRIAGEFPDLVLVLVGGAGPTLAELKEKARKNGLEERTFFYVDVPHSRIATFYEHARVFCLSSRREAFPLVLLEAGSFGLPIVASNVGGAPELISEGEDGRLVPPGNPVALASALRDLLLDERAALAMGERLQSKVTEHFTWERSFRQYEQLAGIERRP